MKSNKLNTQGEYVLHVMKKKKNMEQYIMHYKYISKKVVNDAYRPMNMISGSAITTSMYINCMSENVVSFQ